MGFGAPSGPADFGRLTTNPGATVRSTRGLGWIGGRIESNQLQVMQDGTTTGTIVHCWTLTDRGTTCETV